MVETLQKVEVGYSVFCGKLQKSFATQIDFICTLAYDKFDYLCPT